MEEEVRLGNRDRGWNDPPSLAFSKGHGHQAQSSPRRNLLNQRVAMPQNYASPPSPAQAQLQQPPSGGSPLPTHQRTSPPPRQHAAGTVPPPQGTMPPPLQGTLTPPPQGSSQSGSTPLASLGGGDRDRGHTTGEAVSCETTLAMLRSVLEQCQNSLPKRVITDVERRLQVLQTLWESGKLSLPVQQRTAKLASDIKARRYDSAHEIHLSLMVDHVSEVSQWMVGVKRLIHEARQALPTEADMPKEDEDDKVSTKESPGPPAQDQEQSTGKGDATTTETSTESSSHGDGDSKEEQRTETVKDEEAPSASEEAETKEDDSVTKNVKQLDINQS